MGILMAELYKVYQNKDIQKIEVRKSSKEKRLYTIIELATFSFLFIGLYCKNLGLNIGNNVLSVAIIILLWLFINKRGKFSLFLNKPWAIYFGKYTYSIFTTHEILLHFHAQVICTYYGDLVRNHYVLYPTILLFSILVFAIFCHHFVEMPLSKWCAKNFLASTNEDVIKVST